MEFDESKFLKKKTISQVLVALIKRKIVEGEFNPGDRIFEKKLAKEFGISKSPVREAIQHLSGEGIITIVPNKGPVIKMFEAQDIFVIYSLYSSLEGQAVRLATQHASDAEVQQLVEYYADMKIKLDEDSVHTMLKKSLHLHYSIVRLSRHSWLISIFESILFQIEMVNRILGTMSTKQKDYDDLGKLVDALKRRAPDEAEQIIRKHIRRSYIECMEALKQNEISKKPLFDCHPQSAIGVERMLREVGLPFET